MKPSDKQVGGDHYKTLPIQPAMFCQRNGLRFLESCVIKRVCRHRDKGGAEDIRKAIHELELILQFEYSDAEPIRCDHEKVYAPYALMSSPPEHPWICSKCGLEGWEVGTGSYGSTEYELVRQRFKKSSPHDPA